VKQWPIDDGDPRLAAALTEKFTAIFKRGLKAGGK
jgi:hypothetical protein